MVFLSACNNDFKKSLPYFEEGFFSSLILSWYSKHHRLLPWRALLGKEPNPYYVLVSEFMLQQTTVDVVIAYFQRWTNRWPDLESLSRAHIDEVLHAWQGLGYYRRAFNLLKASQKIVQDYAGILPKTYGELIKLPGIGSYTASMLLSVVYNQSIGVMDGNIQRIISRVFAIPFDDKKALYAKAYSLTPSKLPGDYAQGLMDLGSLVCRKKPLCSQCPLFSSCFTARFPEKDPLLFKQKKAIKPNKKGHVYWIQNAQGKVFMTKNPNKGLLPGLMQLPYVLDQEQGLGTVIKHTFTHFHLFLEIKELFQEEWPLEGIWIAPDQYKEYAISRIMQKVFLAQGY